jgi:hypothetical protein
MNMTDEEILSAAVSVGLLNDCLDVETMSFCILAFAKFVGKIERFKERAACVKTLESISNAPDIQAYANAIRARGEA